MQISIERWAPGGDIYVKLADAYGVNGANLAYNAAMTGDRYKITEALAGLRFGPARDESLARLFWQQIKTDPLLAPFESDTMRHLASYGVLLAGLIMAGSALTKANYGPALLISVGTIVAVKWLKS